MSTQIQLGSVRIALVHIIADATHAPNHGLTAIAASLIDYGLHRNQLACHTLDKDDLRSAPETIVKGGANIVFVSFMSNQLEKVINLTNHIKIIDKNIKIFCGGHHITAVTFEPKLRHVDFQIPGEVDVDINRLMTLLGLSTLRKKTYACDIYRNSLCSLPFPQVDIFPPELWRKYPSVIFSRGCPYSCNYCMSRRGGPEGQVRWKSPEKAVAEIEQLIAYASPNEIYIDDDTLLKNPAWVERFAKLYRSTIGIPFYCNARPETVKPQLVEDLKDAGCAAIGIGIESGSERIRREILSRHMTNECILRAFAIVRKAGLKSWSFNMIGMPSEGVEEFLQTVDLNERCEVDYVRASIFTEFPGMHLPAIHSQLYNKNAPYFRSLESLSNDLQFHVQMWFNQLAKKDKLWLTDSEMGQLGIKRL